MGYVASDCGGESGTKPVTTPFPSTRSKRHESAAAKSRVHLCRLTQDGLILTRPETHQGPPPAAAFRLALRVASAAFSGPPCPEKASRKGQPLTALFRRVEIGLRPG